MAYNPYPAYQPYAPFYQPVQQAQSMFPQQQNTQQQQNQGAMIWVNGLREAENYLVAPNSAVALWDVSAPVIYLKQADASGRPEMKIFDIVERMPAERPQKAAEVTQFSPDRFVTREEFDALYARFEALAAQKETTPVSRAVKKPAAQKEDAE